MCLILLLADTSSAKEWRGVAPPLPARKDIARPYRPLTGASLYGSGLPTGPAHAVGGARVLVLLLYGRFRRGAGCGLVEEYE